MPASAPDWYRWEGDDLLLWLRVQPKASRDQVIGVRDGRLRVRLTAPPAEGKANARLQQLLADLCGVGRSRVEIETGRSGRDKRARVRGATRAPALPDPG